MTLHGTDIVSEPSNGSNPEKNDGAMAVGTHDAVVPGRNDATAPAEKFEKEDDPNEYVKYLGFSGTKLNLLIAICAGVGFVLFGYDQGVMGSLLNLPPFQERFPEINADLDKVYNTSHYSTMQGAVVGIYEIGCFAGSVSCILWGNYFGRRKMIWGGSLFMTLGAIIQTIGNNIVYLWVGRFIAGIGNGQHTSTIPMWQSECSPPHRRGMLIMIEGSLISFGIMVSYWVDFALFWVWKAREHWDHIPHVNASWQVPIAFQIVLVLPTFLTIWMPESPRWLMLRGREREARRVLSALDEVPLGDHSIDVHIFEIKQSLEISSSVRLRDLFKQGDGHYFHRTCLAFVVQMFQQISGINLITYYAGTIFESSIGLSDIQSRILAACNGTEYFLASIIAIFTIERVGRRKLMIWTALGMACTMGILCALLSHRALEMSGSEYDPATAQNKGPAIAACVFLFVFNSFFAIGWLGMTWLYPAECTPLPIRAQANGISTSANWLFNFMVVMITPVAFSTINNYTYLIFAAINLLMVPASWWIFPETAGRSLEEMDLIFAKSSCWNPYDVVRIEKKTPRRYDRDGNLHEDPVSEVEQLAAVEDFHP